MRLINTQTLELEEYFGSQIPKYAILSHTWRDGEVTFQDWQDPLRRSAKKTDSRKSWRRAKFSRSQSLQYLWVDTNCINKESSSELSEAINSMYNWYRDSSMCLAFLDDFDIHKNPLTDLQHCRWFTRGWTLQELLAPSQVHFFDSAWRIFGTKTSISRELEKITTIEASILIEPARIGSRSVGMKMSWAANRVTTREEDMAYCLLGIFEVNMPLLYGEGGRAFIRLQEEIIRHRNDHTLLCWTPPFEFNNFTRQGCLAPWPRAFSGGSNLVRSWYLKPGSNPVSQVWSPHYEITNNGLRITLPLLHTVQGDRTVALLNARLYRFRPCLCLVNLNAGI